MVLGCTSDAGKSLVVTALCRWFARRGVSVAPFKAQNMSNNARVVPGGEIGVAQWLQARAAGIEPTVDMNPVLLKPEADDRSQVIVAGVARPDVTAIPWRERGPLLWPEMTAAYERIAATHDLVVLEGAGSPAEINLPDLVNNRMLAHADASALLVADIDRGGAFAHLVGTWTLVPDETRRRLAGFVLNKFRGDARLLAPGPQEIAARTGMANVGVLPMIHHDLPDEEGGTIRGHAPEGAPTVAIVRAPYASNLDEWHLLGHVAHVRWATRPGDLVGAETIVLPGSKHLAADRAWMHRQGLDVAVRAAAERGVRVLGVCGGAMFLGQRIDDPTGVEHAGEEGGGSMPGLGVLDLVTELDPTKRTTATTVTSPATTGPWAALGGLDATGYEIRHGRVRHDGVEGVVWCRDNVLATTVHGLFESPGLVAAAFGRRPPDVLATTIDLLADAIDEHLDMALIERLVGSC